MPSNLSPLTGSRKQILWANTLRDEALNYIWSIGWHGTMESFWLDARRLPVEASWWIDNRINNSSHDAARRYLLLEYVVPFGADY